LKEIAKMAFKFTLPPSSVIILACALVAVAWTPLDVAASSDDAWEEFERDVQKACLIASKGVLQVTDVQVDPYGSESFGFAVIHGVESGASTERLIVCAYDKQSQAAEISSPFQK